MSGGSLAVDAAYLPGYLLAATAALAWASYSLLTKRLPPFPTGAVGGFCLASGLLSLGVYFIGRLALPSAPPPSLGALDWLFLVLLGLGPMGGAFYAWDAAMKRGDPRIIGAPLLPDAPLVDPQPGPPGRKEALAPRGSGYVAHRGGRDRRLLRPHQVGSFEPRASSSSLSFAGGDRLVEGRRGGDRSIARRRVSLSP